MKIERLLKNYNKICYKITQLKYDIELLKSLDGVNSIEVTEKVDTSNIINVVEQTAIKRMCDIAKIKKTLKILEHEKLYIERCLNIVSEEEKQLLTYYYIDDLTQVQISFKICTSQECVSKKIRKALNKIDSYNCENII